MLLNNVTCDISKYSPCTRSILTQREMAYDMGKESQDSLASTI